MNKYKVPFVGFAYVEAETEAEAFEKAQSGDTVYEEQQWQFAERIGEFFVEGPPPRRKGGKK